MVPSPISLPNLILKKKLKSMGEDARIRVNAQHYWISYSIQDFEKAIDLYEREGIDLLLCENLYDNGISVFPKIAHA